MNKRNRWEAVLAVMVALVFVMPGAASVVSISSSDDIQTVARGMIYVDDDADPGWYDATHVKTIQEGVNNASTGDTIFVYNGTYADVVVNKRVDLVGQSKDGVIVDGGEANHVVNVVADYVNITTFSVARSKWHPIKLGASYATIANCNLYGSYHSVDLRWESNNNNVINCDLYNNIYGIYLAYSHYPFYNYNNIITENTFTNNNYGVFITSFFGYSDDNQIYHNNFINNQNAHDECTNTWDNSYPSGGNYWDDYTGVDEDGDGIGDIPYNIQSGGGDNQDRYPLMIR